jgi:hypothetical protein
LAQFGADYSTESRLAWVGEKDTPDRAAIVRRYRDLFTTSQVESAKAFYESATEEMKERARRVYFALLSMNIAEQTVEMDDRLDAKLLKAKVEIDGEKLPYYQAVSETMHEPDFERRESLFTAAEKVIADTNSLRREMLARELKVISDWGYSNFVDLVATEKLMDYKAFRSSINQLAEAITPIYIDAMGKWVSEALGREFPGIHRVHASYLRGVPKFNQYFPSERLASVADKSFAALGLRLADYPNIHLDLEDRPKKNPRAVCFTTKVPDEIHLIIKPTDTQQDYDAFFHEAGHALHFGLTDRALPLEFKEFSTSHALTEVYSYTTASIVGQPGWLEKYLEISPDKALEISRATTLVDLMMLMRYVGKLNYELDFFESPLDDKRNRALYADTLTRCSGFTYDGESYLDDMDGGLYVADYLRAWITQAMMEEYLTQEFGAAWYENKKTGQFLRELFAQGVAIENEDISRKLGYKQWDVGPLIRRYKKLIQE